MFEPVGTVFINKELKHTKLPENVMIPDLTENYRKNLCGQIVPVLEISRDKKSYLVLGADSSFIWNIDERDCHFIPIYKDKFGNMRTGNDHSLQGDINSAFKNILNLVKKSGVNI
jgi:hypothetical protein